jgi:hypothetical protein
MREAAKSGMPSVAGLAFLKMRKVLKAAIARRAGSKQVVERMPKGFPFALAPQGRAAHLLPSVSLAQNPTRTIL